MSEVKVNKISPRTNCGTVQLGDSGDTITIPAGATISNSGTASGFGSTGEVSWNTTKITADPGNAVSGVGYFTDTSGGAFSVTLPSSPSAGAVVAVADYANTWDTNNLTIARNGSNIEGDASDFTCNVEGAAITFVYVDATKGWVATNTGNSGDVSENNFIVATGGTITTSGNFKIHTFTGPGTFSVTNTGPGSDTVSYLVVAGGGSGGCKYAPGPQNATGGGGGAGGFREGRTTTCSYTVSPLNAPAGLPVSVASYPVTVGGGGAATPGTPPGCSGNNGNPSVFSTITSTAGGGGGNDTQGGSTGGSGGGRGGEANPGPGAAGNTPPVSPPQGNPGGAGGFGSPSYGSGGGGGATAAGADGSTGGSGAGGAGATTEITASPVAYAGGGGAGGYGSGCKQGAGGTGGGGPGSSPNAAGAAGTANTGGGGGGGGSGTPSACNSKGKAGGSGIVVIRYKFQ